MNPPGPSDWIERKGAAPSDQCVPRTTDAEHPEHLHRTGREKYAFDPSLLPELKCHLIV